MDFRSFGDLFDREDRRWVIIALVGIWLSLLMLSDNEISRWFLGTGEDESSPRVGVVLRTDRDVRHKRAGSLSWNTAATDDTLRVGDGLFSGHSSAMQLKLDRGGSVNLGENTLVLFTEVDGIEIPNLMNGNFRLNVNGKMKIALQGKVTEVNGSNAEVQVYFDGNRPQLRLLNGKAKVHLAGREDVALSSTKGVPMAEVTPLKIPAAILHVQNTSTVVYHPHFADRYDLLPDQSLRERSETKWADQPVILTWTLQGDPEKAYLRHGPSVDPKEARALIGAPYGATIKPVYHGANYWWVSLDNRHWKGPYRFDLLPEELNDETLAVHFATDRYELQSPAVIVPFEIETKAKYIGYVLEAASSPEFRPETRKLTWVSGPDATVAFNEPGTFFYRVRGVTERRELTRFSEVRRVEIAYPAIPAAPRLSQKNWHVPFGAAIALSWRNEPGAKATELEVTDEQGQVVERVHSDSTSWTWHPKRAGQYSVHASSIDAWGRRNRGDAVALRMDPKVLVAQTPPPPLAPVPLRQPTAAEGQLSLNVDIPPFLNRSYDRSFVEFEGAAFTMFSRAQRTENGAGPEAFLVGLRALRWFDSLGTELSLRTKLANANQSAADLSPRSIEARLHHRWMLPFNPFPGSSESQVSVAVGYENYRNGSSANFSPGYDVVKAGFTLEFPVFEKWLTGGEVFSGLGLDHSQKTEISGHAHYFFNRDWSLGGGYRVHLFEAGSPQSAPGPLPYREAYGEAYSVFQWRY